MGQIARALSFSRRSFENPATSFSDPAQWLIDWVTGGLSKAGIAVDSQSATRLSAVWRCVRILSETLASLPLFVYERQEPRGRLRVKEHELSDLLHLTPNQDMSSFFMRECMEAQVVLHGNGYAWIRRDGAGRVRELWPLIAQSVEPKRLKSGTLVYEVRLTDGTTETFGAAEILHIHGLSFDGLKGKSVIAVARDGVGLGLAAQDYGSVMFSRGGRVPGVIETEGPKLDADTRKNIRETWLANVGGPDNWHMPGVLPKGWTYKQIGIPPEDAQWIELRKFQVIEVCRFFGVNPHLVFDLERATFSNIEQQSLEFVTYTMRAIVVRWEQELNIKLLTPAERAVGLFIGFNMDGLLRGDTAARGAFYALGRQWGWASANDIRDLENQPGIGPSGDVYLTPINMANAEELVAGGALFGEAGMRTRQRLMAAETAESRRLLPARRGLRLRRRIKSAQRPIIEDRARLILKREIGAVEKELKRLLGEDGRNRRDLTTLRAFLNEFYKEHSGYAAQRMEPIIRNYAELIHGATADELGLDPEEPLPPQMETFVSEYSTRFGVREASESRLQLLALMKEGEEEEVATALRGRLEEWGEKRPGKIALQESTQFMSAAAKVLFVVASVTLLRWVASPDACPFCATLDGRVVGVEKDFVSAGEGVDGGADAGPPMKPSNNIGHPPLHNGCNCDIVAE